MAKFSSVGVSLVGVFLIGVSFNFIPECAGDFLVEILFLLCFQVLNIGKYFLSFSFWLGFSRRPLFDLLNILMLNEHNKAWEKCKAKYSVMARLGKFFFKFKFL